MVGQGRDTIRKWDPARYLNVIVVRSLCDNLLGYAGFPCQAPENDFIVIRASNFGSIGSHLNPKYNLGRTLTHEVGHWLNLQHTFSAGGIPVGESGCYGGSLTEPDCENYGDYVCDTPPEALPNYQCLLPRSRNTCIELPVDLPDQTENYMNYTPDKCMFMFTAGQVKRMHAALNYTCAFGGVNRKYIHSHENLLSTGYQNWLAREVMSAGVFFQVRAYPNPFMEKATLHCSTGTTGVYRFRIFNVQGQLVKTYEVHLIPGENTVTLTISGKGMYYCNITSPEGKERSLKLISQ